MTAAERPGKFVSVPPVVVAAWQTAARSNGGLESLSALLESCDFAPCLVVTNRWSDFTERWTQRAPVELRPMAGGDRGRPRAARFAADLGNLVRNNAWMVGFLAKRGRVVLHCNDEVALLNFALGARLVGSPVLFHVRDTRVDRNLYRLLRWRAFLALSSAFVTLSREMRDWWSRYLSAVGNPPAGVRKIRHLYSVVPDLSAAPRERHCGPRQQRKFSVGVVGAFSPKKGQLRLIEECCLPLSAEGFVFHFFGDMKIDEGYAYRCRKAAGSLSDRSIFFHGYVDDKSRIYGGLDVVVIASRHEGLARSMIEALASGVPALSFPVCSAREILAYHRVGIVVRQDDYEGLVGALREIAADPERLADMSARAQLTAKTLFAPKVLAGAYTRLLGELWYARPAGP
jgi:glycosyltransferase involved in cell wall biosynthesis